MRDTKNYFIMAQKTILKGNPLDDDDVIYFYRNVLIPHETHLKCKWDDIVDKVVKQFKRDKGINSKQDIIQFLVKKKFSLARKRNKNIDSLLLISKKSGNQSNAKLLMGHIRNAFAHNNIRKEEDRYNFLDRGYFDKKTRSFKNEITMIGSIDCELLKKIINIFIK